MGEFRMAWQVRFAIFSFVMLVGSLFSSGIVKSDDYFLADGDSWPGKIWRTSEQGLQLVYTRAQELHEGDIPRIRSLTLNHEGKLIFCSGLDRSIQKIVALGEERFQHGGYLARQVRTGGDGTIYWSGLETPVDQNPLPDGFIYKFDRASQQTQTVMTFSQGDIQRDWWGAFDVRDDHIYVCTFHQPSTIFDVSNSPPQPRVTLPIGVKAFRWESPTSLLACDGTGKLYRFPDIHHPENSQVVLDLATPFVDFCPVSHR
jgi:hypothetical protein